MDTHTPDFSGFLRNVSVFVNRGVVNFFVQLVNSVLLGKMFPIGGDVAGNCRALIYVDVFDKRIFADVNCILAADNRTGQIVFADKCAVQFVGRCVVAVNVRIVERQILSRDNFSVVAVDFTFVANV